jgi:hypothetical protein
VYRFWGCEEKCKMIEYLFEREEGGLCFISNHIIASQTKVEYKYQIKSQFNARWMRQFGDRINDFLYEAFHET